MDWDNIELIPMIDHGILMLDGKEIGTVKVNSANTPLVDHPLKSLHIYIPELVNRDETHKYHKFSSGFIEIPLSKFDAFEQFNCRIRDAMDVYGSISPKYSTKFSSSIQKQGSTGQVAQGSLKYWVRCRTVISDEELAENATELHSEMSKSELEILIDQAKWCNEMNCSLSLYPNDSAIVWDVFYDGYYNISGKSNAEFGLIKQYIDKLTQTE